ncbi:MAG: ATP-dependent helicase [Oscillospiraceae bacterium]|nr:ATP-dependent helicase [Oscillospiraceae bacterium]
MRPEEFDKKYCEKLNPQQLEAVHSVDGPVLLLAVPGSGKTTVLVTRLGYMVHCRNIDPRSILTMTYTVAATEQMRRRFAENYGAGYAREMEICTINSLAKQIIDFYVQNVSRSQGFSLAENEEIIKLVAGIYQEVNHDYATDSIIRDIRTGITYIKNMKLSDAEIEKQDLGVENLDRIYHSYIKTMEERKLMDFDDQLSYALRILRRYPKLLEHFQDRYPYICVDESQDTSKIQHDIIKLLAEKHKNIFMVGDEDQSIYGFRAAYPEALLNFEKDYPGAQVLLMEKNYRSTREIVSAADAFIARNEQRHPKRLQATRDSGKQIQLIEAESRSLQYAYLFEVGRQCSEETAILYRNNDSALPLIDMFERRGVSYNCKKFEDSFFSHRVVADISDIIRFAYEPRNAELFLRFYYKFASPISRRAAELACSDSLRSGRSIPDELSRSPELSGYGKDFALDLSDALTSITNDSAEAAIVTIWKRLKYNGYVAKNGLDASKFDILCELARREKTPADFLKRLDTLRALILRHENTPENKLILSTIHSSKGLEYERVYLLDMFDGILPSKKRSELKEDEDMRQYEEDRRIYYVGMTRAKDELYIFSCADRAGEFGAELAARIPGELRDENEIFDPLRSKLIGKSYTHRDKGKGMVRAQCGDRLLVCYPGHDPELCTLAQLMAERDMSVKYGAAAQKEPEPAPVQEKISVTIGTKLKHKKFGSGVVLSINNGIAKIMFPNEHGVKSIVLATGFKNGIITAE